MIIVGCVVVAVLAVILTTGGDDARPYRSGDPATAPTAADGAFAAVPSEEASDPPSDAGTDGPSDPATIATAPPGNGRAAGPTADTSPPVVTSTPAATPTPADTSTPADTPTPADLPTPTVTVRRTVMVTVTRAAATPVGVVPTARRYANCDEMHEDHPHGVGKPGATDKTKGTHPVTTFEKDEALYSANSRSDADDDDIACEAP